MSFKIHINTEQIKLQDWEQFVNIHPSGNIFQSPVIVNHYYRIKNHQPLCIFCLDSSNKIVGLLIAVIIQQNNDLISIFTRRSLIIGGPIIKNDNLDILQLILEGYEHEIRKKHVLYTQIRNLNDISNYKSVISKNNYHYEDHLNIHIDLKKTVDLLWLEIHPTRRKQITRAVKRGVSVVLSRSLTINEVDICYRLLQKVYRHAKLPLASMDFFINANDQLKNEHLIYALAYHDETIIGFRLALLFKDIVYDWYAGADSNYYDKYPNDILTWELMKWGCINNYKLFDFGGAGKPNRDYGVREYKKKFGGSFNNFGRFERVNRKLLFLFIKIAYKIWKYCVRN